METQPVTDEVHQRALPYSTHVSRWGAEDADYAFLSSYELTSGPTAMTAQCGFSGNLTVPASAFALYCSSSNNGDTVDILVTGLDANGDVQQVQQTLAGQTKTKVGTTETWLYAHRVEMVGATPAAGVVWVYEDDTVTAGVPQTQAKKKLAINLGAGQSTSCCYKLPATKCGVVLAGGVGGQALTGVTSAIKWKKPGEVFKSAIFPTGLTPGRSEVIFNNLLPPLTEIRLDASTAGEDTLSGELTLQLFDAERATP